MKKNASQSGIWWIRRDIRLSDNKALNFALKDGEKVYPLFIFDPNILDKIKDKADKRVNLIFQALMELRIKLREENSDVLILFGKPEEIIPKVVKKFKINFVYTNRDYEPYAKKRDKTVNDLLEKEGVIFQSFKDHVIFESNEITKDDGTPYQVFSAYKKKWYEKLENELHQLGNENYKLKNLAHFKSNEISKLGDIGFTKNNDLLIQDFGEKKSKIKWKSFLKKIDNYHEDRDFPAIRGTSELSISFRFGTISIREVVRNIYPEVFESKGKKTWLDEIIWREFFQMILDSHPLVEKEPYLKKFKNIKFPNDEKLFKAWCQGKTGFPIVDAAMRCFNQTGLMHNRLRMVVGSFLVKTLMIDYRLGEKYFAEKLLDFDLAANNGGWQWVASTGCDASPYFRIFNPSNQSFKFDTNGDFILKYCPELQKLPLKKVHEPWKVGDEEGLKLNFILGKDYPYPVVDYSKNRKKVLEIYKKCK